MKKSIKSALLVSLLLFTFGCASTNEGYSKKVHDFSKYANLGEAIRSVGGVQVTGGNTMAGFNDAVINLRGQSSLVLGTQPLYVVNNVPIGTSYNTANNLVHPANIVSIRVVRGMGASAIYGEDANNGAIIIVTNDYKPGNRRTKKIQP